MVASLLLFPSPSSFSPFSSPLLPPSPLLTVLLLLFFLLPLSHLSSSFSPKTYLVWFLRDIYSDKWISMAFPILKKGVVAETGILEKLFSIYLKYIIFLHGHKVSTPPPTDPPPALPVMGLLQIESSFHPHSVLQVNCYCNDHPPFRDEENATWVNELLKTKQAIHPQACLLPDLRFLMATFSCLWLLAANSWCLHGMT